MAMNNTYERKVRANPTALNPNQHYVQQYDAMAQLTHQIAEFGTAAANLYAKADYEAAQSETKAQFNNREVDKKDLKRRVELNQDPRKREAEYAKRLELINKKYNKNVDSRCQKEYDSWVELADKKDLLDLRFNATKDLNKQTRETTLNNVKMAAQQTVGANEAYVKMLDADVSNNLSRALKSGLISKPEYDAAIQQYSYQKKQAQLDNLLVTDPESLALNLKSNAYGMSAKELKSWKKKADDALSLNQLRGAATLDAEHKGNLNAAFELIASGKTVPQNMFNGFNEKEQEAISIKQIYAAQGYDVPTNAQTYGFLQEMYSDHPERFKAMNLYEYAGQLSTEDLSALQQAQDTIIINQKGKAEINPDAKVGSDLMKVAYERMGWKASNGDYEKKYNFNRLVNEEMQAQMHDKGRALTSREQETIINDMTKEVARRGILAGKQKAAEINAEEDTPYVNFEDIPAEDKAEIDNIFIRNGVSLADFEEDDYHRFYENMAGALALPKGNQPAAIERVIKEVNKKARKMNAEGVSENERQQRRHNYTAEDYLNAIPDTTETPYGF